MYHDCDVPEGFIPELTDPYTLAGTDEVTVFTGDSFVNATSVPEIMTRFNTASAIFDMEIMAVAIAVRDYANAIPLVAVKYISDVPQSGHNEWSYDAFADSHSDFSPLLARIEDILA
jgi:nucleoside phosphorylase